VRRYFLSRPKRISCLRDKDQCPLIGCDPVLVFFAGRGVPTDYFTHPRSNHVQHLLSPKRHNNQGSLVDDCSLGGWMGDLSHPYSMLSTFAELVYMSTPSHCLRGASKSLSRVRHLREKFPKLGSARVAFWPNTTATVGDKDQGRVRNITAGTSGICLQQN
jgi:hypothetical protein